MTSDARALIKELAGLGAHARLVDGQLRVKPPIGGLNDELRERIRANLPAVIDALTTHPCGTCGRIAFPVPTTCYRCRKDAAERPEAA